jgi:hypothetical protein
MLLIEFLDAFLHSRVRLVIVEIAGHEIQALGQPVPFVAIDFVGGKLVHVFAHATAKFVIAHFPTRDTDYGEVVREAMAVFEIVESGN